MKNLCIITLLICIFCLQGFGQSHGIDSLKNAIRTQQNDTNKANNLNILSNKLEVISSYDSSLTFSVSAQKLSEKLGFKKGIADAYVNLGDVYYDRGDYAKALEYDNKALAMFDDINNIKGIATALWKIGSIYDVLGDYAKALEFENRSLPIFSRINDKQGVASTLLNIGNIYGNLDNNTKAEEYYLKALTINREIGSNEGIATNLCSIGITYMQLGDFAKALEYSLNALAIDSSTNNKSGTAYVLGNIGIIYESQGKYAEALSYDLRELKLEQEIGEYDNIAVSEINIGYIYFLLKNYKQAGVYLNSSLDYSKKNGDKLALKGDYFALAALDSAQGNFKTALEDYKRFLIYRDSLINQASTEKITLMEARYTFEMKEDSIRSEHEKENLVRTAEINKRRIINNGSIIILLLTLVLVLVIMNRQKIKREKEKDQLKAEKEAIENELKNAQIVLDDYVKNMVEKNELLEQFKVDVENLKNLKSKEIDEERVEHLEHLNKVTILTEEDWNRFKMLFEQVYKGFFIRLKEKIPNLTQAETRLICLTKLQLDTKQMSGILGVSNSTIKQSRYRLRKKLGLSEEGSIEEIVKSI
jgi:tetratricopeptide (TPR) repeat protein